MKENYQGSLSKKIAFITIGIALVVIIAIMSCAIGSGYGFIDTFEIIYHHAIGTEYPIRSPEWWADYYLFTNCMPGVCMALIAGMGLALAGTVMQTVMQNPLADAYTTGISSGACFGAVCAIILGFSLTSAASGMGVIVNAFIGAMIPAFIMVLMMRYVGNSPSTMILVGTALSFFFNAMVTLVMITASSEDLQDAFLWQIGSVAGAEWSQIPFMLIVVAISSMLVELSYRKLNIISLGDSEAKSLGLDVSQFRTLCLILTSILVASIISFTGIIGFVGLVSPHIVRFIMGNDNRFVVPGSMIVGAILLLISDAISRCLYGYADVPIGVIMSFIGAPMFLYLIIRRKSSKEMF